MSENFDLQTSVELINSIEFDLNSIGFKIQKIEKNKSKESPSLGQFFLLGPFLFLSPSLPPARPTSLLSLPCTTQLPHLACSMPRSSFAPPQPTLTVVLPIPEPLPSTYALAPLGPRPYKMRVPHTCATLLTTTRCQPCLDVLPHDAIAAAPSQACCAA